MVTLLFGKLWAEIYSAYCEIGIRSERAKAISRRKCDPAEIALSCCSLLATDLRAPAGRSPLALLANLQLCEEGNQRMQPMNVLRYSSRPIAIGLTTLLLSADVVNAVQITPEK
jgi:hypothetical protein